MEEENQETEITKAVIDLVTDHLRETSRSRIVDLPRWVQ